MSEPTEGSITPGIKKTTRKFAPVKRGASKSAAGMKREAAAKAAAAAAAQAEATTSESTSTPVESTVEDKKIELDRQTTIGTMRPESTGRLQSINDGQQKTRGGAAKMKFKPTIPHKRNKKEISSSTIDEALGSSSDRGRGRGRGERGRGGRGRGRGRGNGLVIVDESTASGIFSLGPSAVSRGRPGFGGGGFASYGGDLPSRNEADSTESDMVEMFTASVGKEHPVTFRHTSRLEGDVDPVTLSQPVGKIPWMNVKTSKKEMKKDADIKAEDEEMPTIGLSEEEEEVQPKTVYMDSDSPAQNIFALNEKERLVCVAEEELLYFQLPTVVPKFDKKPELIELDETDAVKQEESAAAELPKPAKKSTLEEQLSNINLNEMPEGQVGKLIVYKSGKMKMQFGNILFDIERGMQSTFLENVMVVDHESEETKKAIELGHIVQKFVCAPNMNSLLKEEENALV